MKKSEHKINRINLEKYVIKAQKGNKRAIERIVKDTSDYIYYYCLTLLCDEDKALEAVQDIYVILLTKINTVEKPEAFLGWLKVVTSNYCKNKLSRKVQAVSIDEYENFEFTDDTQISLEECVEKQEICNEIILAIKQLPDYQRECVMMYYYHQMSINEIATTLEIKEGTVKSRLFNARQEIKRKLENKNLLAFAPLSFITHSLVKESGKVHLSSGISSAMLKAVSVTFVKTSIATKLVAGVSVFTAGAVVTGGIMAHNVKNSQISIADTQPLAVTQQVTTSPSIKMEELFYSNGLTDDDRRTVLTYNDEEDMNSYNNKNYVYDLMCNAMDNYKTLQGTYFYVNSYVNYYSSYSISFENGANSKELIANTEGEPVSFGTYDGLNIRSFTYGNSLTKEPNTFSEQICEELILKRENTTEKDFDRCESQSIKSYRDSLELDFVSMIASKNRVKEDVGYSRMDYACLKMSYVQYMPEITASTYLYDFENWEITDTNARRGRFVTDRECYSIKGSADGFNDVYSFEMYVDKETGALIYFLGCDSAGEEVMALVSYEFEVDEGTL